MDDQRIKPDRRKRYRQFLCRAFKRKEDRRQVKRRGLFDKNSENLERFCNLACPEYFSEMPERNKHILVKVFTSIFQIDLLDYSQKIEGFDSGKFGILESEIPETDDSMEYKRKASDLIEKTVGIKIPVSDILSSRVYEGFLSGLVK